MQTAYDLLAFVERAWPVATVIAVVVLGLIWIGRTEGGRSLLVELAVAIIGRVSNGVEGETLTQLDRATLEIERRLSGEKRSARREVLYRRLTE